MTVRVAINGFGRIGRNVLRAIAESGRKDIEIVALNDLGPVETNAHLLRFDSVHGRFPGVVTVKGDSISIGNGAIKVCAIKDPATLMVSPLTVTTPGKRPCTLSKRSRCALVSTGARSLMATISMSLRSASTMARRILRPMRPNPLMATRIVIAVAPGSFHLILQPVMAAIGHDAY